MLAETIDAGFLRTAAERKNDERILVQIRLLQLYNISHQRDEEAIGD